MKITLTEASKIYGVTKQAISVAIKQGYIPVTREKTDRRKVFILSEDVEKYRNNRWSRAHHFEDGELSPDMAAEIIGCPVQRIYHLIRLNQLAFWRQGKQIITIKKEDVLKIKDSEYLRSKKKYERKLKKKMKHQDVPRRLIRKTTNKRGNMQSLQIHNIQKPI